MKVVMDIQIRASLNTLVSPAEPLYKRVPTHDEYGHPLSDFMMIIPGLKENNHAELIALADNLDIALHAYSHAVVFADLNPKLNLLWVSIKPIPGMILELATAINVYLPHAKLVAEKPPWK